MRLFQDHLENSHGSFGDKDYFSQICKRSKRSQLCNVVQNFHLLYTLCRDLSPGIKPTKSSSNSVFYPFSLFFPLLVNIPCKEVQFFFNFLTFSLFIRVSSTSTCKNHGQKFNFTWYIFKSITYFQSSAKWLKELPNCCGKGYFLGSNRICMTLCLHSFQKLRKKADIIIK